MFQVVPFDRAQGQEQPLGDLLRSRSPWAMSRSTSNSRWLNGSISADCGLLTVDCGIAAVLRKAARSLSTYPISL